MAARPSWRGQIRLALVSIPVEIFPATKSGAEAAKRARLSIIDYKSHHSLRRLGSRRVAISFAHRLQIRRQRGVPHAARGLSHAAAEGNDLACEPDQARPSARNSRSAAASRAETSGNAGSEPTSSV